MSNIHIKITGDGKAFISEAGKADTAIDHLGDTARKTNTDLNHLGDTTRKTGAGIDHLGDTARKTGTEMQRGAEQGGKAVTDMGNSVGAAATKSEAGLERIDRKLKQTARTGEISAAQTTNALRQLPMQMTDIVTQLAGGQNPFLIMVQQGGQIKDSFGGIGPAIKGITAAISPMAVAVGTAAAAGGALAYAFYSGSREAQDFSKAIAFTGNVTGVTTNQLTDMSSRIGDTIGTQAQAAETLALIAGSGRIAAESMERYGEVAVRVNKATGKEVADTVKEFASLADASVAASLKLNDTYHYLTASVLEQIQALEKQGRTQDAVKLAQDTFANATDRMSKQVIENVGNIERAWRGLKSTIAGVWDDMLNVGRKSTPAQELAALQAQLKATQAQLKMTPENGRRSDYGNRLIEDPGAAQQRQDLLAREKYLKNEIDNRLELQRLEGKQSAILAEQNRVREDGVAAFTYLSKATEDAANKQEKYNTALAKERDMQEKLRKSQPDSPLLKPAAIAKREAKIRTDIYGDEKKPRSPRGAIGSPTDNELASLQAKIAAVKEELAWGNKLNDGEKEALRIREQLGFVTDRTIRQKLALKLISAEEYASLLRVADASKARADAVKKQEDADAREIKQLTESAVSWENKLKFYGMAESELDAYTLAQLNATIADKEALATRTADTGELAKEIALLKEKAELLGRKVTARQGVEKLDAAAKAAKDFEEERKAAAKELQGTYSGLFQGMEDAAVNASKGIKVSSKDMFNSLISDLVRYQWRLSVTKPLMGWMDKMGGFGGLISSGLNLLSGGGGVGSNVGAASNGFGMLSSPVPFANGGIMTSAGPLPLRTYSKGGIANSPQLALYAEAGMSEAYVPLPDGRSIPVTMRGDFRARPPAGNGGNGGTSPINIYLQPTIDARGADAAAVSRIETALARLADNVKPMATEAVRAAMLRNRQSPQF
ncbi:phage tail length tape measure family protein [Chitinibacter sp. GC72]|uniref:phage tail length tape measure family protein n=1 Tax=Chitinibacter sp. GC72 TaxID=1526917 RepID=UPI0012F7CFA2|nr:phage tail length tape measure family protein [Chitinibacter sp. GC72]